MQNILELKNISKNYEKSGFNLQQISFALPYGSIMGFVGENGAGKSTTINCILNTVKKNSGKILLWGKEMTDKDTDLREKIGVVYDGANFPGYLSAKQLSNIMQGVYKRWDDSLFKKHLHEFRLKEEQKIKTYSKGMTMKLAIAVALAHHPKLLILDEATGGLDPIMRDDILDVFLDFVQKDDHSILLSSHITGDLEKIADYITFIHDGKIILTEQKDALLYNYAVMRCKESQFNTIIKEDMVAYRKKDMQIDVLIKDDKIAAKKYKEFVTDHVSIDEILLLLVKGERLCAD